MSDIFFTVEDIVGYLTDQFFSPYNQRTSSIMLILFLALDDLFILSHRYMIVRDISNPIIYIAARFQECSNIHLLNHVV